MQERICLKCGGKCYSAVVEDEWICLYCGARVPKPEFEESQIFARTAAGPDFKIDPCGV